MARGTLQLQLPLKLLHQGQLAAVRSIVPFSFFCGGYGSGKTLVLGIKAIILGSMMGHGYRGMLVSPTYTMFERNLLPTIRDDLLARMRDPVTGKSMWELCHYSAQRRWLTLPNGFVIMFASADRPDSLLGPNLAFILVDEATLIAKLPIVWKNMVSRLRAGPVNTATGEQITQLFLTGTPEGMDFMHSQFLTGPDAIEEPDDRELWRRSYHMIHAKTTDNPAITDAFVNRLRLGITSEQEVSYIGGKYKDFSRGRCYWNFRDETHLRAAAKYDPRLPLRISFDFNLDPMCCTIHQVRGSLLMTIDEITLRNSNTPEVCREIIKRYGREGKDHRRQIVIYGDSTGGKSTAAWSDYDVIFSALRGHFPGELSTRVQNSNPHHKDRLNSVNAKLRNAHGQVGWWINPKCPTLIQDLRLQKQTKEGKKEKAQLVAGTSLGHSSDTVDYIIHREWPYRRESARSPLHGERLTKFYVEG